MAQRRAQSLQEVPISIAAVSGEALQRQAAANIEGLNRLIPNVIVEHVGLFPTAAALSVRGVGYVGVESYTDPDVALYVNGVYQARNGSALSSTVDVEQIEVLRGPQGTLYGRNAYAGAVALRTRRPDMDATNGSASVTIGNYGRVDGELVLNAPIVTDKVAVRVALRSHELDGYYKNDGIIDAAHTVDQTLKGKSAGAEKTLFIRPSLRFTPDARWDIQFIGEYYRDRSQASPSQHGPGGTVIAGFGFPGHNPFGDDTRGLPGDGSSPFTIGYSLADKPTHIDQYFLINDTSYDLGFGTLRGIFSYMKTKSQIWADTDGENINVYSSARYEDYHAKTAELQYVSSGLGPLGLVAGMTYLRDSYNTTQLTFTNFAPPFVPVFSPFTVNPSYINNTGKRESWAAYAQAEYHITAPLSVVLGGRYSWERKYGVRGQNTTLSVSGFPPSYDFSQHTFSNNPLIVFGPQHDSWSNFSPRVGVNYKAREDVLLYAFWQKAYKSGGYNANNADRQGFETPYGEESVDDFEAGFKSEWLDHRVRVNVNAFYGLYDHLQRSLVTPSATAPSGVVTVTTNAADIKSYGLEAELAGRVTPSLTVFANVGWNKAKYTSFCADLDGAEATQTPASGRAICGPITTISTAAGPRFLVPNDWSSLKPIRAPRWDITTGFTQRFDLDPVAISVNGTANYRSSSWVDALNRAYSYRPSALTFDGSLVFTPVKGAYTVTVWGQNLTNKVRVLSYLLIAPLFADQQPTNPRTFGVTLAAKF
ncbi:MAG: TonB-dependent receptor [Caulobacterales bacterium]|nr:TonB-dependent receptor [Caulobacterales bacterium]